MHCAFALMIGGTGVLVCRHWYAKAWWAFWPVLICWVVIVTANHYWVDAALGWMVAIAAALVAQRLLARVRPEAWAWQARAAPRGRGVAVPRVGLRPCADSSRPSSLPVNGTLGAPKGPRSSPQRPRRGAATGRSSGPTPASG